MMNKSTLYILAAAAAAFALWKLSQAGKKPATVAPSAGTFGASPGGTLGAVSGSLLTTGSGPGIGGPLPAGTPGYTLSNWISAAPEESGGGGGAP